MAKLISRINKSPKKPIKITLSSFEKKLKAAKIPFLRAYYSKNWGAQESQHREQIRGRLFKLTQDPTVLKYSTVSKCDVCFFSISHNPEFGALITARQPIGIDIENCHRPISLKTLNRITSLTEQSLELMPIEFWVAKEAAFKACSEAFMIRTISEINIRAVKKNIFSKMFRFSIKPSKNRHLAINGQGCILTLKDTTMGIAWLRP